MRKKIILSSVALSLLVLSSCSSKLGELSSNNFSVDPNPLETVGGQVPAVINGSFPEKYMNKKAVVTVIPELRYGKGGVAKGNSATFQGEKVQGNDQVVSYIIGGHYTLKTSFNYLPEMQKSDMYLTFDARIGNKKVEVPAVKVASGVIATPELYKKTLMNAGGCIAPDSFQRVRQLKQEANIKFLINQATLRSSELKNNSVKEFIRMLKKINAEQEALNVRDVEVKAYASPEGGVAFNDKLANQRQNQSEKYVKNQLKQTNVDTNVDASYTAQDWDGFQKLVSVSNIQDKDVILRVLSMYKDPAEREQQIRNMSEGFRELADEILPQLRRSRLIINYESIGRSDEQIKQQYDTDATKLGVDEMLYAASIEQNPAKKEAIYKKTAEYYDKDYRAYNNLAVLAFNNGDGTTAQNYLDRSFRLNPNSPEGNANLALMSLKDGKTDKAENYLANAINANGFGEVLGNLNIAKGNYAQAEENFNGSNSNSAVLAQILNKDYSAAAATLKNIKNPDAMTDYLHAILSARQGNGYAANSYLNDAIAKDPSLSQYSANDLEFINIKR
jgi:Tfp pilus assembly protein PilF